MLLYIVRHGLAGQHGDPRYPDDNLRPLTAKGRKQFARMAKKLYKRDIAPQRVATSPLVRCRQTAELLCERFSPAPRLVELAALQPGSDLEALIAWSNEQQVEELAWVGHAPDVERLLADLVGASPAGFAFAKGAVAAIGFADEVAAGLGQLRWLATPAVLGC